MRAQIAAQRARTDTALAQYEQTVLRALEETENALVTHARTRDQWAHAADAAEASATAARLARTRYEAGAVDFLAVLDAERTQLEAEDRLAKSHGRGDQLGGGVQGPGGQLGGGTPAALHSCHEPGQPSALTLVAPMRHPHLTAWASLSIGFERQP